MIISLPKFLIHSFIRNNKNSEYGHLIHRTDVHILLKRLKYSAVYLMPETSVCRHYHVTASLRNITAEESAKETKEPNSSRSLRDVTSEENPKELNDRITVSSAVRSKIVYNSILHKIEWENRRSMLYKKRELKHSYECRPVALKYIDNYEIPESENKSIEEFEDETVVFPYKSYGDFGRKSLYPERSEVDEAHIENRSQKELPSDPTIGKEKGNEQYIKTWMNDYECYDGDDMEPPWELNYGTPDTSIPVSNVRCGGCGALLHCQEPAIPGYLPSEIFLKLNKKNIAGTLCQRCHFIRYYDTVLSVSVPDTEYPKLLAKIKDKFALVILMVDLLDFPCSVWPQILDIIGRKRPVVVVGNKIDLIPQDCPGFLDHVKKCLKKCLEETGLSAANIKHVELISARTGFGIEELITRLQGMWQYKGDVYLIGCTNVGKSSLFNALLQSDYCKIKAVDLIERATISPWPGTTLNLLKFPILRPSGWRQYMRTQRLLAEREQKRAEEKLRHEQLKRSKNVQYATLIGHIGRTFQNEEEAEVKDPFSAGRSYDGQQLTFNPNDPAYKESRWCFDTPGTIQPDQILNLLTTEELIQTLPKEVLVPRTFCLKPFMTLFVAGLGRVDYVSGTKSIRFTVFASNNLPITICRSEDADDVYSSLLGSSLFVVPCGGEKRLSEWPALATTEQPISVTGISSKESCADIVLSSAGWISVTPYSGHVCELQAWTPEKRGIYLRQPPLLRYSVCHRGPRIRKTPAYNTGRAVYIKN